MAKKIIKKKKKEKEEFSPMDILKQMMGIIPIDSQFISSGIESSKISAIKIEGKKFKTKKMILIDPVPSGENKLIGEYNVCYCITRIE